MSEALALTAYACICLPLLHVSGFNCVVIHFFSDESDTPLQPI